MFYHSKIKEALARKGGDVEVAFTRKAGDGTILAHNYLRKGYSRIVAVSGDGTINKVANGFFEVKEQEDGNRIFKPINSNAMYSFSVLKDQINNYNANLITIIGGYGSGKSLLCMYLLYYLCKEDQNTVPLYITLGKLEGYNPEIQDSLTDSIYEYIKKKYKIVSPHFLDSVESGGIIFILDALDEISRTIDEQAISKNINNIKRLAVKGNKVILTSRHTYLTREHEEAFVEDSELIEILDFDSNQINNFIAKRSVIDQNFESRNIWELIDQPSWNEVVKKPLFLHIICTNYKQIEKIPIVNPATIFKVLTDEWIVHDIDKRSDLTLKKKQN